MGYVGKQAASLSQNAAASVSAGVVGMVQVFHQPPTPAQNSVRPVDVQVAGLSSDAISVGIAAFQIKQQNKLLGAAVSAADGKLSHVEGLLIDLQKEAAKSANLAAQLSTIAGANIADGLKHDAVQGLADQIVVQSNKLSQTATKLSSDVQSAKQLVAHGSHGVNSMGSSVSQISGSVERFYDNIQNIAAIVQ